MRPRFLGNRFSETQMSWKNVKKISPLVWVKPKVIYATCYKKSNLSCISCLYIFVFGQGSNENFYNFSKVGILFVKVPFSNFYGQNKYKIELVIARVQLVNVIISRLIIQITATYNSSKMYLIL